MARRPPPPRSPRREPQVSGSGRARLRFGMLAPLAAALAIAAGCLAAWLIVRERPERLRDRAEAAARAGDWTSALQAWRALNRTRLARGRTYLAEARACLALDRAAEAERALRLAIASEPADPEPWRLQLELLRVEDRAVEAQRRGWEAYAAVPPEARRGVLRDLTLALLAELPETLVRDRLGRWIAADPADIDARVALSRRIATAPAPRSDDPDRATRIATLRTILSHAPDHLAAREALIAELADAGATGQVAHALEAWPAEGRDDPRYQRLLGRWELDDHHQPARAVAAFERVLAGFPQDGKTRYRLARALQALGRTAEARTAAETFARLREVLDPMTLGPRLNADLGRLDDPRALLDLADLCARAGLARLADAWRREAEAPRPPSHPRPATAAGNSP